MIRISPNTLSLFFMACLLFAMPEAWAKKKIVLAQQLDPINDDCKVCHPVVKGGEEIELEFLGLYDSPGFPFFVAKNVEIKVYAYHGKNLVWQSTALKPAKIGFKTILDKSASVYYVNFSTNQIPLSSSQAVRLKVKLKNLTPAGSTSGKSFAMTPAFKAIRGTYKMYFDSSVPRSGVKCYTKPGCNPGQNTYATKTKPNFPKLPVSSKISALTMKSYPASSLRAGKKLIYADSKSGNKLYAYVNKSGRSTQISGMELRLRNGQVLKLSPERVPAGKARESWGCNSSWNGYLTSFSHPRLKYKVYYANCGGAKLSVQYPYRL